MHDMRPCPKKAACVPHAGWAAAVCGMLALSGVSVPCTKSHGEVVTTTGAWALPPKFQYHLDAPLAEAIAQLLHAEAGVSPSVLDIGAGKGLYVRFLRSRGVAAEGTDGALNISNITHGLVADRDLTRRFDPCRGHDWVLSLEVAEHIPRVAEETYLRNLRCSARSGIIMSWAPPGQPGSGHVNLRTKEEARRLLSSLGFELDEVASTKLRAAATLPWFQRNLMVLRDTNSVPRAVEARGAAPGALQPQTNPASAVAPGDMTTVRALFAKLRVAASELGASADELRPPLDALEAELGKIP